MGVKPIGETIMQIMFINSCVREKDSRSLKIAQKMLEAVPDHVVVKSIDLNYLNLVPYNTESFNKMGKDGVEQLFYDLSKEISESDVLFIATPFWDMGIPALLKTFLEKISIPDVMFHDDGTTCLGISKIKHMVYVCTRGMDIPDGSELEQASPYLKALCHLWGIEHFHMVSVYNMDYVSPEEAERRIKGASELGSLVMNSILG